MKDYLNYQGVEGIMGGRDAIRLAFKRGLITDGEGWMEMLKSRNKTAHSYEEETAADIEEAIFSHYYFLLKTLIKKMEEIA